MSILTMNLRQLYQRRGLWLAYVLLGPFVWTSVVLPLGHPAAEQGLFIGLILLAFAIGVIAAVLQMEIMTKPLAFCLPRHRQNVREFIFVIGIAANAVGALLFLFYPRLPLLWRLLVLGSAFSAGLAFYLVGAWWAFRVKQPMALVGFLIAVFFFGRDFDLHLRFERLVVLHPLMVMAAGGLCGLAIWRHLGHAELARRSCLRPWVGFEQAFNRDKLRASQRRRDAVPWARLKDHPRPWVETLFLTHMEEHYTISRARFIWGALYIALGILVSQWWQVVLFVPVVALVLGYLGPALWPMLGFVPIVVLQTYFSQPPVYSSMMTAGGRRERFASTLATTVVGAASLILFITAIALVSVLLATVLPNLEVYGKALPYRVVGVGAFYAPLLFLPLAATAQLILYRRPALMLITLMILISVVIMAAAYRGGGTVSLTGTDTLVGAALCWLAYVLVLAYAARKRCLVR